MMKLIPLHCCCDPSKRLGYLQVPRSTRSGQKITAVLQRALPRGSIRDPMVAVKAETMEFEVADLLVPTQEGRELVMAAKSHDYPIEKIRLLPIFVPEILL